MQCKFCHLKMYASSDLSISKYAMLYYCFDCKYEAFIDLSSDIVGSIIEEEFSYKFNTLILNHNCGKVFIRDNGGKLHCMNHKSKTDYLNLALLTIKDEVDKHYYRYVKLLSIS